MISGLSLVAAMGTFGAAGMALSVMIVEAASRLFGV